MALPPAAVGNSPRPVLEMQKWPSGRGERQPGMGTPESSMPSGAFAVVRTSHWRHTAFGIPKWTSIAVSKVPAVGIPPQPVVTSLLMR